MSFCLLHEFNVFEPVFRWFPQAAAVKDLDELARRLWHPTSPGLGE